MTPTQRGKLIQTATASILAPFEKSVSTKSPSTLRRMLTQAEGTLAKATAELIKLTDELAIAGSDHTTLALVGSKLANAQVKVDLAEEVWLSLAGESETQGLVTDEASK